MKLDSAVAIVTGGGSGIGRVTAEVLARKGARCVIIDQDQANGASAAADMNATFVPADVADEAAVAAAVASAAALGPVRVLVNAAGISLPARTVDRSNTPMPLEHFDRHLRINLLGTFNCVRLAAAAMALTEPVNVDGARGVIVNVASAAAFDGQIGQAAYSASKGGVVAMTLPIARDLSAIGVRVNTIAPGLIDTPIYNSVADPEGFKAKLSQGVPFPKRLGTADEVASMVLELITNDYMNGEVVRVDGGVRFPPR